jgi:hypothetical protein
MAFEGLFIFAIVPHRLRRMRPHILIAAVTILSTLGCSKDEAAADAAAAPSASAPAPSTVASVAPTPSASASAAPEVQHDCPTGSTGLGSFGKPCEAKGAVRMVEISWNGKSDTNGSPTFNVKSKSTKKINYGRVAVYFYDKAGKQIDVKESVEGSDKVHAFHTCSGRLFAGVLDAGEKAAYNFSCVQKKDVPDGVASMEAEAQIVGFAADDGKKIDFYWKNADLTPEQRAKGGIK